MNRVLCGISLLFLATILSGCGDTPSNTAAPEEKSVDYGKQSSDKMKTEFGTPSKDGMKK
jgi:uncharacterized protein YceK